MDPRIELLNWVANQPEVLATAAPDVQQLDLSDFFDNPNNRMYGDATGLALFIQIDEGVYRCIVLFTRDCRGRKAAKVIRRALKGMFTTCGAHVITGTLPRDFRAARALARALNAQPVGSSTDGAGNACIDYVLERAEWARKYADA